MLRISNYAGKFYVVFQWSEDSSKCKYLREDGTFHISAPKYFDSYEEALQALIDCVEPLLDFATLPYNTYFKYGKSLYLKITPIDSPDGKYSWNCVFIENGNQYQQVQNLPSDTKVNMVRNGKVNS